ncbi:MAG: dihydrolipoyllysine-residue succinyltransferase [Chlamydiales bacterium]
MREEIKIPPMGESITEAIIGSFLKPSGSAVEEGDEIVELETEKVTQLLYAPISGVISWKVSEGDNVTIGTVIGEVDSGAAPTVEKEKKEPVEEAPPPKEGIIAPQKEPAEGARVMQKEFIAELKAPTPPPKREEVKKAAPEKAEPVRKGNETRRRMTKIRQTIASHLVDSLHQSAMLTTFNEVDMTAIMDLRAKYKTSFQEKHGVKLGFMSFFVKASVEGLKTFPDFNSYIDGDEIVHREYFNIGIAVATPRGLVVPVVRDCDRLTFAEIEQTIGTYAQKAREGHIALDDLQGGGFTITNGGVYGSLLSTPILNPGQVGILGMHTIAKRPVVIEDQITIRPMMYLALSYDHRLVDGKEAVSFLVHIKEVLEDPSRLMFIDTES